MTVRKVKQLDIDKREAGNLADKRDESENLNQFSHRKASHLS